MSRTRKVFSLIIALLLIGCGAAILGNWLFLGGGLPKLWGFGAAVMITAGVAILWDDISTWRAKR